MAGHRPWKEIRGVADRDLVRRRRVEVARREVENEQATPGQATEPTPDAEGVDGANGETISPAPPHS